MTLEQQIRIPDELKNLLRSSRKVAVLTGAGISAESGIPTFRDAQTGLWAQYRPEDLATLQAFQREPQLVWEWYQWRRTLIAKSKPNLGHLALAEMERYVPELRLITQNVDGFHQQAGSGDRVPVIELHGNILRNRCSKEDILIDAWNDCGELPPRCPSCGSFLRPDVVWFGEPLPSEAIQTALEVAQSCQVFFSIGTSSVVEPAASLPFVASRSGAVIVEINPIPTPLTQTANYHLAGPSGKVLPHLVDAVWKSIN
jgi:NAD-dependent deacetylase